MSGKLDLLNNPGLGLSGAGPFGFGGRGGFLNNLMPSGSGNKNTSYMTGLPMGAMPTNGLFSGFGSTGAGASSAPTNTGINNTLSNNYGPTQGAGQGPGTRSMLPFLNSQAGTNPFLRFSFGGPYPQ